MTSRSKSLARTSMLALLLLSTLGDDCYVPPDDGTPSRTVNVIYARGPGTEVTDADLESAVQIAKTNFAGVSVGINGFISETVPNALTAQYGSTCDAFYLEFLDAENHGCATEILKDFMRSFRTNTLYTQTNWAVPILRTSDYDKVSSVTG